MSQSKIKFSIPKYSFKLLESSEKTLQEIGQKIEQYAKESAPKNTSEYASQIKYEVRNAQHQVIAYARYSAYLEYGTKPHLIKAKTAKYLHFIGKDGKDVFAKVVNHPGTKPQPVMRNAAMKVQQEVGGIFINHFIKG